LYACGTEFVECALAAVTPQSNIHEFGAIFVNTWRHCLLPAEAGDVIMVHEQSLPSCFRVPKRPQHEFAAEVREAIPFRDRGDGDVRQRGNFLRKSRVRLAWKSVEDQAPSNPAL
jgi:hypothetical protein